MKIKNAKHKAMLYTIAFALIILIAAELVFSADKKTNKSITEYITSFGWEIEDSPSEISHIKIPDKFDGVFSAYNSIQQESGLNLEEYSGKTAVRYTYKVLNHKYSSDGTVFCGVLFYKSNVIAADISSNGVHSFICGINDTSGIKN